MSNEVTQPQPQEEKRIPSIIPLALGLVGLLAVIVGAFLHATVERMGDLNKPTAIFVVGLALIGLARVIQETRISAKK